MAPIKYEKRFAVLFGFNYWKIVGIYFDGSSEDLFAVKEKTIQRFFFESESNVDHYLEKWNNNINK